jgi:hypothetical protein
MGEAMKFKLTLLSVMLFVGVAHGEGSADLSPDIYGNQVVTQPAPGTSPPTTDPDDPANRYNNYDGRGAGTVNKIKDKVGSTTNKAPDQSTINPGANTGAQSQSSGAGINAAVGAALIAACLAPCPKCMMPLCAMGAMALMQSGHDSGAAGQSYDVADVTKNDTTSNNPTGKNPDGSGDFDKSQLDLAKAKLGEAGYTVTENGVKFPDGSMHASTDLISPAAMASAGLDPSSSKEAQSLVDSIVADASKEGQNGARVIGMGVNGGAGGGAGGMGGDGGASSDSSYGAGAGKGYGLGADDKKKLIAGKTVMFDGEPIGVRGNNIFDMIHTCYEKKRASNQFIDTAGNDAIMPASVTATLPSLPGRAPAAVYKGSNR